MSGPLADVRIVELAGIGPSPYAAMLLADLGANILRLERADPRAVAAPHWDLLTRSRASVAVNLKHEQGRELVLRLCERADALIEGFRPGVTERLGLGPDDVRARNPRLVYGRMTGWGQDGPLAPRAGHDINYIAISGALWPIGRAGERPTPPLNLVGDFGGGGMLLALGVLAGILSARSTGEGQVVDAAMVDGSASLMAMTYAMRAAGFWRDERGVNLLDTGAHFYEVYETSDGRYVAVGAIEPQFYAALLEGLGLTGADLPPQMDRTQWPQMKERFSQIFASRTRDEWDAVFAGTDACVSPVLSPAEAAQHPHNVARGTFLTDGPVQPGPAPRFSGTPGVVSSPPETPGSATRSGLVRWGLSEDEVDALCEAGALD